MCLDSSGTQLFVAVILALEFDIVLQRSAHCFGAPWTYNSSWPSLSIQDGPATPGPMLWGVSGIKLLEVVVLASDFSIFLHARPSVLGRIGHTTFGGCDFGARIHNSPSTLGPLFWAASGIQLFVAVIFCDSGLRSQARPATLGPIFWEASGTTFRESGFRIPECPVVMGQVFWDASGTHHIVAVISASEVNVVVQPSVQCFGSYRAYNSWWL